MYFIQFTSTVDSCRRSVDLLRLHSDCTVGYTVRPCFVVEGVLQGIRTVEITVYSRSQLTTPSDTFWGEWSVGGVEAVRTLSSAVQRSPSCL